MAEPDHSHNRERRLLSQPPILSVDGAFSETVDLGEDGEDDENVKERVTLKEDVALAGEKPLRHVTHVEDAPGEYEYNRE